MSAWAVPGYTEERELGRGASGRVVSAVHEGSGRQVAVKYLAPRLFRDPRFLDGFRQEAEVLRSLDVPQVVRLFDYVEAPGEGAAIVMELVNGVSLHQMITRQGSTSPESALVVLKGSLLGLASAHQLGIVHRDYKPENVLVDDAGNSKLTDFGIAIKAGKKAPAAGTPLYMAPEQWNGGPATPATDIYAATAVFFECLTGKTPFSGRPGQLALQHETAAVPIALVDEPLQELIERGMAKDPRDRPPNAMEFVAELNWVADQAYGPDWEERGRGDLARRSSALLLLLLGGVAGAAGASFTVTLLAAMARRRKAVIAGAAVGIVVAITATTTVFALQGNNGSPSASSAASTGPGTSSGGGTGGSTQPGGTGTTGGSATGSPTGHPSATGKTTSPAGNPTTTTPGGNPGGNPTTTSPAANPTTPTTSTSTTTPPPAAVITLSALSAAPGSPANAGICTDPSRPTFTVTAAISASRSTSVTYHWSSGKGGTVTAGPGGVGVSDNVTSGNPPWNGSDTLTVTSPSSKSASTNLSSTCTYSTLSVTNPGDQSVNLDVPFSVQVQASGGDGHYTFSWSSPRNNLPKGLSINPSTGLISGTPQQGEDYILIVTVTDGEAKPQSASTGTFYINVNETG
ncbi:MAG TPA: protein kinase [Trebonia sp.]|jgi:serine/threonine-protein kinase|nr:protein kinase [Trebonia sp.]